MTTFQCVSRGGFNKCFNVNGPSRGKKQNNNAAKKLFVMCFIMNKTHNMKGNNLCLRIVVINTIQNCLFEANFCIFFRSRYETLSVSVRCFDIKGKLSFFALLAKPFTAKKIMKYIYNNT